MNNGSQQVEQSAQNQEPRLPQIDPITFSALNMLDGFVGKAPLTRQEHADANKSLQHIVQMVEMLQANVKDLAMQNAGLRSALEESQKSRRSSGARPDGSTIVAEVAEEVFENARARQ